MKREVCLEIVASEAVEQRKRSRGLGGGEKEKKEKKNRLYRCIVVAVMNSMLFSTPGEKKHRRFSSVKFNGIVTNLGY